jgi:hypothetical protein
MNRRKFVVVSTVSLVVVTAAIIGLAFYSDFAANAFVQGVPDAIRYLPADTQAVFGINVQKLVSSEVYLDIMAKHEQQIATDLTEFITRTGVDPRRDVDYIIGAARQSQVKGAGIVIAVGRFNPTIITDFINSKATPIKVDYLNATVLMMPETNKLEKGIAFLRDGEIALGDLESLKAVLDVRNGAVGLRSDSTLSGLLGKIGSQDMFWFAGDATVLARVPANTPFTPQLSAIQSVYGTLNLGKPISGKISVTAKDPTSATQLADLARGIVALGNLAAGQNPDLAELARGVQISQNANQFDIAITLPYEMLQKLEAAKHAVVK